MFRLESYITPILLDYVAKYVKNIREEDASVSLWEGEATFHNLDMRLDVLEEEFNLPVELVSGHIHELTIQVPWHRLMSEPTRIIINTIEFVAKLRDGNSSTQDSPNHRSKQKKKREGSAETQQSTVSGMVSKIINNIAVTCHNIILKYVEEDIVVSMNVQLLNFGSASEEWKTAMVDVHPVNVVLRKLLQVSDLTICLDKRNAAGRIDVCQEPLLYRCTLECRLLHKYNANNPSASTLRLGIFTKSMDINVSSLQFPMVMRLIKLLLAMKPSDANIDTDIDGSETDLSDDLGRRSAHSQASQGATSYFGWAWRFLPSFENPPDPIDESEELIGHIVDIGIYAEELNFQLKNSEYIVDPMMGGMRRIKYTPIMRISLGGIYYERSSLKETDWGNVKAGLSSICVEPLGSYRTEDQREKTLVNTPPNKTRAFIDKSLFDNHYACSEKAWATTNFDDYTTRITDEYMLYRSPVLAFDVIEYRPPPKPKTNETLATVKHDLALRVQYRLLSAGITFHYSQSFLQVKNVIRDFLNSYDYPAYTYADNLGTGAEASQNSLDADDVDYVSLYHIRNCDYKFELRNFVVQFHAKTMPDSPTPGNRPSAIALKTLPFMELKIALAEGSLCSPQYGNKIVLHAIHLADKPREILDACYDNYKFNVKNFTLSLLNSNIEEQKVKLLLIPKLQVQYNRLLRPSLWKTDEAALDSMEINSDSVNIEFSKRELFVAINLCNLVFHYDYGTICALANLVQVSHKTYDIIKLQTHFTKMRICTRRYRECFNFLISIRSINSEVCHTVMQMRNLVLSTTKGSQSKWFEIQLQFPFAAFDYDKSSDEKQEDPDKTKLAIMCALWIESFRFTVDTFLLQFLRYQDKRESIVSDNFVEVEPNGTQLTANVSAATLESIDGINKRANRVNRRISQPEETVHFSSDRDSKLDFERIGNNALHPNIEAANTFTKHINFFKALVISIEIADSKIQVAETMTRQAQGEISNEYTLIMLPKIKVRSMHGENVIRSNLRVKMMVPLNSTSCSWTIELLDLGLKYRYGNITEQLVDPIRTTIIIALSHKSVHRKTIVKNKKLSSSRSVEHVYTPLRLPEEPDGVPEREKDEEHEAPKKVDWVEEDKELDKEKNNQRSILSVNLHIDTSQIVFYGRKLKVLHENYLILRKAFDLFHPIDYIKKLSQISNRSEIQVLTATEECPIAKDFLELDSISLDSSESSLQEPVVLIVFCQWTIPRIKVELESMVNFKTHKIVFVLEDLLLNVDKHSDFIKYTSKIENMFVNYYDAEMPDEWTVNECLRIRMSGDNTNLPLLSIVITTVNLSNLHSKIGVKAQSNPDRTLSEILISVLPIELILDLNQITEFILPLCELLELINAPSKIIQADNLCSTSNQNSITPVCDLPMVHLDIKGMTVYIPTDNGKKDCTVLVCKVTGIKVTPNLDNPLQRTPIRPDLYNKAAELGMLSTPGAIIEDRQYELSMQNISIATGNWLQTLEVLRELKNRDQQNPAVEWNNQTPKPELKLVYIFNKFTFIAIYAPAMTFHNILVCGQSIEYNCATDFVATFSTHQISLISCIIERFQRFSSVAIRACVVTKNVKISRSRNTSSIMLLKSVETIPSTAYSTSIGISDSSTQSVLPPSGAEKFNKTVELSRSKDLSDTTQSDSGVQSLRTQGFLENREPISLRTPVWDAKRHIPQTISFVAGVFVVKLFDAEEINDSVVLKPLILLTISQPNFMFTQNIYDAFQHASIFNFNAHIPAIDDDGNTVPDQPNSTPNNPFRQIIFDTNPGDLNSSGIPPPMINYNSHTDRMNYVEVDIELRKPIIINLREKSIHRTIKDMLSLYMTVLESPCLPQRSERPVVRCSKLRQLQLQCMKANRLRFTCHRVAIKFFEEKQYACKFVTTDVSLNFKFRNHPEKASIKGVIGSLYVLIDQKVILHPIVLRFSTDFLSEPWWDQPLVHTSLSINVFHLDLGILMLVQLRKARMGLNRMLAFVQKEWNDFLLRRPMLGVIPTISGEGLFRLKTPVMAPHRTKGNNSTAAREEFYQDDLRAGAFQFVDMNTDTMLPMPYQIQIIKKNYGIICWRYPQPRRMVNINIFPVPMPVDNPIQIRCRMEYFSETHETFLHYCDFLLSENTSREVELPERKICAYIWRVVIMQSLISVNGECFEPSEDDEDLISIASMKIDNTFKTESDNDFILHPKVLVGCMRIDTAFQTKYIPKFQVLLSCNSILVNLLNQPNAFVAMPILLKEYEMKKTSMISQIFFSFELERLNVLLNLFEPSSFSVDAGALGSIKCLDYGFLNMLEVMEPTNFQSYIEVVKSRTAVKANFLVDKLRFNFGPSVIHSVLSSKIHWEEVLSTVENLHTLIPKCVVVNRSETPLGFGQTGTSEKIMLYPMECQLYHFRSDYHNQELTFYLSGDNNALSDGTDSVHIPFKFEGSHKYYNLKVGSKVLIVIIGKLSSTQIYVLVKGQIEIMSKLDQEFYLEFRGIEEDEDGDDKTATEHYISNEGRATWIYPVNRSSDISMRLKLSTGKGKGRTGDIPLKANNSLPWLVKIPMLPSHQFMSVWVRVLREDLDIENQNDSSQPQRILIQIWPIFEVCNMLSCSVKCKESSTDETFVIQGEGGSYKLRTPTTHLTEHNLTFDYGVELGRESYHEYTLMLKAMDWHKFFHYDHDFLTIENAFKTLKAHKKSPWPLDDEEELRVKRNFNQCNSIDVIYKAQATQLYSCTLGLNILPWGTFINATGLNVSICTQDKHDRIILRSNNLEMITALESSFTIDVGFGTNWVSSYPICLSELEWPTQNGRHIMLYANSYADVVILRNEEVIKLVLELKVENEHRIFKLRSKFVIANCTGSNLYVLPLALEQREKSTRDEVLSLKNERRCNELNLEAENDDYCAGNSIDIFYDINARKVKRNPDTLYVFFVCFVMGKNTEVSIPVPLQTPFTRRCFSLQDGQDSVPVAVTLVEKNGVTYLTLFRDTVPAMIISNHTNLKFIVAQTSASENSNVTNTTPDYNGKHFEWHQLVCPQSKCYYTPPLLYINFPDVEFTFSNLSLALYNDDPNIRKKIAWSKPIRTDKTWKKFLRVPNHGDVKVSVCDKHRVIRISIYYVSQQMEFLVKDLRSRLLQPQDPRSSDFHSELVDVNSEAEIQNQEEQTVVLQTQNSECDHFSNMCPCNKTVAINFFVKKIVFSLQTDNEERDYMKTEVCNVYIDDMLLRYKSDAETNKMVLEIPNLQVDNQLYSSGKYDFPVLLCSEQLYRRKHCLPQIYTLDNLKRSEEEHPIFATITLHFYEDENSIQSVHCKFSPFRAYIEDSYINQLLEAMLECEPSNCVYTGEKKINRITLSEGQTLLPESVVELSRWIAEPLELRSFIIEPLNMLLSVHTSLRLYIALDHSPLSFSRYERRQILTVPLRFGQSLGMHYLSGAIFGAGWVVGSLEILGSPSGLARSFTTGLRDFISMPVHGLLRGPWGFVVGITQGSASLLRNVTAGTVNSVTKLASSVARNLDRLTLDEEHIERTDALRRTRPQGFADGLAQGMTGLGISILGAVGGLAHHTLEARDSVGVITGLTKGIVGAFAKPISGAAEMLALAGQGVLQTVGFNAMPQQVEPAVSRNAAVHPSGYRIWTILPVELNSDQILFYYPITLVVQDQLRPAYIFLTSAVLAIMEADNDKLTFLASVDRVEMARDRDDPTKYYLHRVDTQASESDMEEQQNFTNQRIMKFLTTSHTDMITVDSLNDLLNPTQSLILLHTGWVFYISEVKGDHLLHYLKVINKLK